jgi:hypothetical protein
VHYILRGLHGRVHLQQAGYWGAIGGGCILDYIFWRLHCEGHFKGLDSEVYFDGAG